LSNILKGGTVLALSYWPYWAVTAEEATKRQLLIEVFFSSIAI
jgi:hypothetical protein